MIQQGLALMVIGMGVVFSFLALLVIVMMVLSSTIRKFFPEVEEPVVQTAVSGGEAEIAAAIAAVKAYTKS